LWLLLNTATGGLPKSKSSLRTSAGRTPSAVQVTVKFQGFQVWLTRHRHSGCHWQRPLQVSKFPGLSSLNCTNCATRQTRYFPWFLVHTTTTTTTTRIFISCFFTRPHPCSFAYRTCSLPSPSLPNSCADLFLLLVDPASSQIASHKFLAFCVQTSIRLSYFT